MAITPDCTGEWIEKQKDHLLMLLNCEFEDETVDNIEWMDSGWNIPERRRPNRVLSACYFGTVIGIVVLQEIETT